MNPAIESFSKPHNAPPRESLQSGLRIKPAPGKDILDLLNGNDLETAIAFTRIRKTIELDPAALKSFIRTLVQPGREDLFVKFCRLIIQSGSHDLKTTLFLINAILPEKLQFAESVLKSAEKRFADDPGLIHTFGKIYIEMENPAKAVPYLERLHLTQPGNLDVRIDLGRAYEDLKQTQKAYEVYAAGLEYHPGNTRILYAIARQSFVTGNVQEARRIVRRILEVDPAYSKARILHSRIRKRLGFESEAQVGLDSLIREEGPTPQNSLEQSCYYIHQRQLPESVLFMKKLVEDAKFKNLQGTAADPDHLDRFQEYLEMCEANLGFDNNTRAILKDFAENSGDDDEMKISGLNPALKYYLDLHKSDPDNTDYLEKLSILYLGAEEINTAHMFCRKLEELDPLNDGNIVRIAVLEVRRGKREIAIRLLRQLLKLNPNHKLAKNLFNIYTGKIPR